MKKYVIHLVMSIFIFLTSSSVFALDAPQNLRVSEVSPSSITIDWEGVPGAIGYYYYIGTQSQTYTDGIDLIDTTEYVISDIDVNKVYYITITSVDEFGVESDYATEITYSAATGVAIEGNGFRISSVDTIDANSLHLNFSRDILSDAGSPGDFILEEKNTGVEVSYGLTQVDSSDASKVIMLLNSALKPETEYELTVLDIRDVDSNTIESGIDAFISFMSPKSFASEEPSSEDKVLDLDSAVEAEDTSVNPNTTRTPTQSSGDQETKSSSANDGNAGVTMSKDMNDNTTTKAATENEKLPQTGPEHILLALVAILLSAGVFYSFRRR